MSTIKLTLAKRLSGWFAPPWPFGKAVWLAIGFGAASPLVKFLIFAGFSFLPFYQYSHAAVPFLFLGVLIAFIRFVVRQTDRSQFHSGLGTRLGAALAAIVLVAGILGSVWCYKEHICMDGHMEHGAYPEWHYGLDASWTLCLVLAVALTALLRSPLTIAFAVQAAFLVSYRFVFESFHGVYTWLPL